jgi:hypothetical protein
MGTPRPGRSMMWLALAIFVVIILLAAAGCARPTTTITFLAIGKPDKASVIVHIDMTFTSGSMNERMHYPRDFTDTVPLSQHQVAEQGTVASYLFTVFPVDPGQVVECFTIFNGNAAKPIDHHVATFPKPAVCGGPPV